MLVFGGVCQVKKKHPTLPETNSSHLKKKIRAQKGKDPLPTIFRSKQFSGRVYLFLFCLSFLVSVESLQVTHLLPLTQNITVLNGKEPKEIIRIAKERPLESLNSVTW